MLVGQKQSSLRSEREAERFYPVSNPSIWSGRPLTTRVIYSLHFWGLFYISRAPSSAALSRERTHRGPSPIAVVALEAPGPAKSSADASKLPRSIRGFAGGEKIPRTPDAALRVGKMETRLLTLIALSIAVSLYDEHVRLRKKRLRDKRAFFLSIKNNKFRNFPKSYRIKCMRCKGVLSNGKDWYIVTLMLNARCHVVWGTSDFAVGRFFASDERTTAVP